MDNFFSKYRSPLAVLILLVLLCGGFAYSRLKTALFPEITFPKIKVIADAGQQPVAQMMLTVTKPLENAIKQTPDLQLVRSTTSRGSCEISAFMDWNADIDLSQQRIESRIAQIRNELPPDVQITVEKMNPSILPVMGYILGSHERSPVELKKMAVHTIKPFLSQVNGVSEIRVIGGKTKEYQLELNIQKMSALGITPDAITQALSQTNFIKSNGYLADYRFLYLTVTDAQIDKKEEIEDIVVRNDGKRIVLMKDLAAVEIKEAKEYVAINADGEDGILVAVVKQPNANLIDLSEEMKKKVEDLRGVLPSDVTLKPFYIQADFVNDSVKSVTDSLWVGLALAIIVAILFLRSLKASITILITIPVTLGLTLLVLWAIGQTFNIMTLGAIAASIGLIIDDAIVVVEQIHRAHEEQPEAHTRELLGQAIRYLLPAMLGSSVSTIVIFIPFVLMSGVAGAYFKVMTDTVIITLVCSFFVTWLLLPVIYLMLTGDQPVKKTSLKQEVAEQRWVRFFVRRWWLSLLYVGMLVLSMIYIFPNLQTGFLPEMDEGSIVLDYESPPGTSLQETDRMLREVEKIIIQIPEVQNYSRRTGTQMGFFITEPNRGDYLIQLKKQRDRTTEDVIADIRSRIEATQPALRIDFGQVIGDMLGDLMASVQPIEVKLYGSDQKTLQELSRRVADVISKVPGAADVFDGIVIAGPSVSVEPDFVRLAQFGITPASLQYQLQTALEGNVVGTFYEPEQLSNIRLTYPNHRNLSIENLRQLQIFLPDGKLKPITELADVELKEGEAEIERENLQMMGVVTGRLDNRDLGSVMQEVQSEVTRQILLPAGYHIQYGGAFAEQQQSFRELLAILIIAGLLVFGTILFLFRDILLAILILAVAALGISGSYGLLFLTNTALNVGSYTGLIMIVGIIGENAIFTCLQFRETLAAGRSVEDAVIFAISTRLRPKLMTAFGAIIALMPLALGIGTGAQLHQPLAISVIGGFLAAIPLLLIVLPTGIRIIYREKQPRREKTQKTGQEDRKPPAAE